MAKLLIIVLVAYWGYNYWKFRRNYRYYTVMAEFLKQEIREKPDYVKKMKLSSALIHIQQYASAYELLNEILNYAPYYCQRQEYSSYEHRILQESYTHIAWSQEPSSQLLAPFCIEQIGQKKI